MDTQSTGKSDWTLGNFLDFEKSLNGGSKLPLHSKRKEAFAEFTKKGFPTPQMEEWKYTNVSPIKDGAFTYAQAPSREVVKNIDLTPASIPGLATYTFVLVDGYFSAELSKFDGMPNSIIVNSIAEAQKGAGSEQLHAHLGQYASVDEHFVALNTSFIREGVLLYLPKGTSLANAWTNIPLASFSLTPRERM